MGRFTKKSVVLFVETRPSAIKMLPVYFALKQKKIPVVLISVGQHAEILQNVLEIFKVKPDIELKIMKKKQDLFHITDQVLKKLKNLLIKLDPRLVVVQGDTTSAMTAALSAFYLNIPVAHVEAGLRTKNIKSPFPEEMNRRVISLLADYHFAPTSMSYNHLVKEGIDKNIFLTGNTIVDALFIIKKKLEQGKLKVTGSLKKLIQEKKKQGQKILLLTAHRRESFKKGLSQIFNGVKKAVKKYPQLFVIFPYHPNPIVQEKISQAKLNTFSNIHLIPPLPYHELLYILMQADGVLTDSGGIQEEAISLNKPVIVLRNETDRPEGIKEKVAILAGTNPDKILKAIPKMLKKSPKKSFLPIFGDGKSAQKIAKIIKNEF